LVKLQFGEYVSLGKVESELKTCPLVENVCVYGQGTFTYVVALVVPDRNKLTAFVGKDVAEQYVSHKMRLLAGH
jgi:long-chain acyl-CoA synthetase